MAVVERWLDYEQSLLFLNLKKKRDCAQSKRWPF